MGKLFSILIIEPAQTEQFLYSEIFSETDFNLINCLTVGEALQWLKKDSSIELIITDLYLSDYVGVSVVEQLRKYSSIPIIIVSSIPYQLHELKKFSNVEAFYKPYNMASLMRSVLSYSRV